MNKFIEEKSKAKNNIGSSKNNSNPGVLRNMQISNAEMSEFESPSKKKHKEHNSDDEVDSFDDGNDIYLHYYIDFSFENQPILFHHRQN